MLVNAPQCPIFNLSHIRIVYQSVGLVYFHNSAQYYFQILWTIHIFFYYARRQQWCILTYSNIMWKKIWKTGYWDLCNVTKNCPIGKWNPRNPRFGQVLLVSVNSTSPTDKYEHINKTNTALLSRDELILGEGDTTWEAYIFLSSTLFVYLSDTLRVLRK